MGIISQNSSKRLSRNRLRSSNKPTVRTPEHRF
jgi:hypothetical protein